LGLQNQQPIIMGRRTLRIVAFFGLSLMSFIRETVAVEKGGVKERIVQAILLLQSSKTDATVAESTQRAIDILSSVNEDLKEERRLEDGSDDVYSYYDQMSDVTVTYDNEDNTVVTVDEGVIVVVDYGLGHYLFNTTMVITCILVGALMSGLLMGIMSLDPLILGVKARAADTEAERRNAKALLPFVQQKNRVLVAVLLINCGVNESLPIFLEALIDNPLLTVLLSLTAVLVVGEILPSAYFTGRDQIKSASRLISVLRLVIVITSPISYPISKLMDYYFLHGDEASAFKRGEISALVRIQYEEHLAWKRRKADALKQRKADALKDDASVFSVPPSCDPCNIMCSAFAVLSNKEEQLSCVPEEQCLWQTESMRQGLGNDDIVKVEGALLMKDKKVEKVYTPMHRVFSVSSDTIVDEETVVQICSYGYSRIPIIGRDQNGMLGVSGVLLTNQLVLVRKEDKRRVATLTLYVPPCVSPETSLAETLNIILAGNRRSCNMALVCTNPELATAFLKRRQPVPGAAGVLGIITLDNVLEELIQEQIYDEKDKNMKPTLERAKWAAAKWKAFTLRKRLQTEVPARNNDEPFDYVKMQEIAGEGLENK
jgi:metal transporter CNNM